MEVSETITLSRALQQVTVCCPTTSVAEGNERARGGGVISNSGEECWGFICPRYRSFHLTRSTWPKAVGGPGWQLSTFTARTHESPQRLVHLSGWSPGSRLGGAEGRNSHHHQARCVCAWAATNNSVWTPGRDRNEEKAKDNWEIVQPRLTVICQDDCLHM